MSRLDDRAIRKIAIEIADRRIGRRGWIVITASLTLAGMLAAFLVVVIPSVRHCDYAGFDPTLKNKSYICSSPNPDWLGGEG